MKKLLSGMIALVLLSACGGGGGGGAPDAPSAVVTTVVGAPFGTDGSASQTTFHYVTGMVRVGNYAYFTDSCTVRKMDLANGAVTTIAGQYNVCESIDGTRSTARFKNVYKIASDGSNLYLGEINTVRRLNLATGAVTTVATGLTEFGAMVYAGGKLYLSHKSAHSISQLDLNSGVVSTFAGLSGASGSDDGVGTAARFNKPLGMATDGANIYVSQSGAVRKIEIDTGTVSTITINSLSMVSPRLVALDGNTLFLAVESGSSILKVDLTSLAVTSLVLKFAATDTLLYQSYGLVSDGSNLYVSGRRGNSEVIAKLNLQTADISLFSGVPALDGIGTDARLNQPYGMVSDGNFIYIADSYAHAIRKYNPATGAVTTLAGQLGISGTADGTGTSARFSQPANLAIEGGNLYVTERENHAVRKIVLATGEVSTLAGMKGKSGLTDGDGVLARFNYPEGIVSDKNGNLYVADSANCTIRKIVTATGSVSTVAGTAGICEKVDGTGRAAHFSWVGGLAIYGNDLYISNYGIRKMNLTSLAVSTPSLSGAENLGSFGAMTSIGQYLYFTLVSNGVINRVGKLDLTTNTFTPIQTSNDDNYWSGIVLHGNALYVSNMSKNTISKITGF